MDIDSHIRGKKRMEQCATIAVAQGVHEWAGSDAAAATEFYTADVAVACEYLFFDGTAGIGCLLKNELASVAFDRVVQHLALARNSSNQRDVDHSRLSLGIDFVYKYHTNISNGLLWHNNHKNNRLYIRQTLKNLYAALIPEPKPALLLPITANTSH
jgi:hypothetical protein